jgi:hypothetical protein
VLTLLAGPGVVWELAFGSWVLLQPERVNAYAQAVIRTLQADEHQRGCLMEERVLKGDPAYPSSMPRLAGDEERFVLLAMHQTLVERGLPQPVRAKDNSPAIHRWVSGAQGGQVPSGTKEQARISCHSFRPSGAGMGLLAIGPAMNRWAIVGRPWRDFYAVPPGQEVAAAHHLRGLRGTGARLR